MYLGAHRITEMVASIGAIGKNLAGIVRQRSGAALAFVDIGRRDRDLLNKGRIGIGADMGLEAMNRWPALVFDPVALTIIVTRRGDDGRIDKGTGLHTDRLSLELTGAQSSTWAASNRRMRWRETWLRSLPRGWARLCPGRRSLAEIEQPFCSKVALELQKCREVAPELLAHSVRQPVALVTEVFGDARPLAQFDDDGSATASSQKQRGSVRRAEAITSASRLSSLAQWSPIQSTAHQ